MKPYILLCLIILSCSKPKKSLVTTNMDTLISHMNSKAAQYWDQEQWDSANNYLNQFGDTVRQLNHPRLSFYWDLNKVVQGNATAHFDSASIFIRKASSYLGSNAISKKDSFRFYISYTRLLKEQKLFDSALRMGNEAYYLTLNDSTNIAQISYELAVLYAFLDDLPNLRKYILEALKFNKQPGYTNGIATLLMHYYESMGQTDSLNYYLNIIQNNPDNEPLDLAALYENSGIILVREGKIQEGLQNVLKSKRIRDSIGVKNDNGSFYNNLADTYGTIGQFNKAFKFIDSAIYLGNKQNDHGLLTIAWQTKSELYFKSSQYKNAYAALDSSYSYSTIEQDSTLRKYGRELETKYAVKEKDNQINTLSLTNQANVKIRNQQRLIIFTMIIAIALIGIIVFQFWRRRQTEIRLRETVLKQQILRARLDPHFLFNSLSILMNLIRTGLIDKALVYLGSFSKLMRFTFEYASENYVLLNDEIEGLENYLKLQEIYRPGLFKYQIIVYDGYEDDPVYIPPMLLQPIVENAIHHGFNGIDYTGLVTITVERRQNTLHCTIEDNGKGLEMVTNNQGQHSTAINQERLAIIAKQTGNPAILKIIDKKHHGHETGTKVEIEIPYKINRDVMET